jgi:gliding motility-associated-like protein
MKQLKYFLVVFIFGLLSLSKLHAQIDTVFWFAAPWVTPDHDGNTQLAFRISSFSTPSTVRLQLPSQGYDTTFIVPANSVSSIPLNHIVNNLESKPADLVLTSGIKITSDELITVVYDFISDLITITPGVPNNPETYSLKGQNGMGTEFVVPFQTLWNNRTLTVDRNLDGVITQPKQFFSVVATQDNTTIYITPRCAVVGGHPANTTYSVFLPFAGNVYTCQNVTQSTSTAGNTLSGSIVIATKPVSVTINDDSVNPAGGGSCFDLMGDQIVPTDVIGNEYIINRGFLNAGSNESIFIIASENFTTITVNDGAVTTQLLNQGSTWQYSILQPLTSIIADKPVYVIHMSGYGCELGLAIIPPTNCAGSDEVAFGRNNSQQFLLNILCRNGDEGSFQLNGSAALVPAAAFNIVPGTGGLWRGAQINYTVAQIAVGTQNLITNSSGLFSLGIINGGSTTGCLYHYMSSFNRKVITKAGNDTTLCNGVATLDLNGTVTGGASTGLWTVLNGTGTLNSPTNLVTSYDFSPGDYTQGPLTFVLESTGNCDPVRDTIVVSFVQSPLAEAGNDNSYCKNNIGVIPIAGSVVYAAGADWTGGNGGAFGNPGNLSTNYTPSPTDIANDSVVLYLTSAGSFFACPDHVDSLTIYFTEAPSVFAGSDLVLCASATVINLAGSVSGSSTTGIWSSSGSGSYSPTASNPISTYTISSSDTLLGNITITLTSTNNGNCLAEKDSIDVVFVSAPQIAITSSDSICANLSLMDLSGTVTPGFSTLWSTGGFGSVVSPSSLNTQYTITTPDTTAGFVDLYLTTTAGICPSSYDSLRVFFIVPPKANAGIDQNFCSNQVVQLTGSITGASTSGSWSTLGTGTFSPSNSFLITNYIPSALDISNGSVNLILTTASVFGCAPDFDMVTINFLDAPIANFSFTTACFGDNTVFNDLSTTTDGTIATWDWQFGDAGTSIAENPLHTYPANGNYTAQLIATGSNGCSDTISYPITVNPVPLANFSPTVVCENTPIVFTDLSFISSGSIASWSFDFGGGNVQNVQNPTYVFGTSGNYPVTLTVTSALGCIDDTLLNMFIYSAPTANFTFTPSPALVLENVYFTDQSIGTGINGWLWNYGDGEGDNAQNPIHSFSEGGDFNVMLIVTDANGCQDTVIKNVTISLPPVLPSGFSPNGDGENDVHIIRGGPFKTVDYKVYNNWGELIFSSTDALEGWDGTFKGELAPIGVYTWTFTVTLANDKLIQQSGDVTLIR